MGAFFLDTASVYSGHNEERGFEATQMPTTYKGSNLLGKDGVGYFTFTPSVTVTSGWEISVHVPEDQGYKASCWGIRKVQLPAAGGALSPGLTNSTLAVALAE